MRTMRQKRRRALLIKGGLLFATAVMVFTPKFEIELGNLPNALVASAQAFE